MRVLIGSLIQESNTFSPLKSDLEFFRAGCLTNRRGKRDEMADTRTELGGFITECRTGSRDRADHRRMGGQRWPTGTAGF